MIKRHFMSRMKYMLWYSDMEATRFTLGIAALAWALFLYWPGDLFPTPDEVDAGQGRIAYAIMAQIMCEDCWATLWLTQGSVMLWSLMTGIRNHLFLILDAVLGVLLWSICVGSAFVVFWPHAELPTALMIYNPPAAMSGEVAMIAASWWILIRYKCSMNSHDRKDRH